MNNMRFILFFVNLFCTIGMCFNLSSKTLLLRLSKNNKSLINTKLSNTIYHNSNSYTNKNKIISNVSSNIDKIFMTYTKNNTLIFYKNGIIEEIFNKTLIVKPEQDDLELHLVSNLYFQKIYQQYNISMLRK